MTSLLKKLTALKVIPVIAIKDANYAVALAQTLIENGMPGVEITFRTHVAAEAIRRIRTAFPYMTIGAGTVLTKEQVDQSIEAGVDFIVSPGLNPNIVQYCIACGIPVIPGVNNPGQVEQAIELGLHTLKFFPAEPSGGLAMLKALSSVYPVSFMPTGGLNPTNVKDYLALGSVFACGGSWMVPSELIDNQEWDSLGALVKEAIISL